MIYWWVDYAVDEKDYYLEEPQPKLKQFHIWTDTQNMIADYLWKLNPEPKMLAKFRWESKFKTWSIWKHWERFICQLIPNKTNNRRLKDKNKNDRMFQVESCVDKRLAVPNVDKLWFANHNLYMYMFEKWPE